MSADEATKPDLRRLRASLKLQENGRAFTDEQKRAVLERIYASWVAKPDMRLGQLIVAALPAVNAKLDTTLFYIEDEKLVAALER